MSSSPYLYVLVLFCATSHRLPIFSTMASSPASSPRLPSPPPIAEDQIGPTSPGVSLFEDHGKFPGINSIDTGAARRIRPGTKAEDMTEGPPLVELQEVWQ